MWHYGREAVDAVDVAADAICHYHNVAVTAVVGAT